MLETWSDWSPVSVRKDQVQRCGAVCFCNSFSPLSVVTELLSPYTPINIHKHIYKLLLQPQCQKKRKAVFVFIMLEYICTAAVFSSCLLLRHAKFNGGRYFSPVVYSVTLYNTVTLTCINSCLKNAQIVMKCITHE